MTTTYKLTNEKTSKLTVCCVGDIAPVLATLDALRGNDSGKFPRQLSELLPRTDLIVANLEAPVVSQGTLREIKRYNFRTEVSVLNLFGSGSLVSLANNHIMDYGEEGLTETITALTARGIVHAGAGRNLEEACRPALIDVGGVRVAMFACADPRFQAATVHRAGTCPATIDLVEQIVPTLQATADVVIVSVHMGIEFHPVPSKRQLELAEVCAGAGASVVQFHHAHTISGVQKLGECIVLFGTGNFLFPYAAASGHRRAWHKTAAWTVDVVLADDKSTSTSVLWTPYLIDQVGLPRPAPKKAADLIDREINRWSERIRNKTTLPAWRLVYVFRPGYLWLVVVNFGGMVRRRGLVEAARQFGRALRASFLGRS